MYLYHDARTYVRQFMPGIL